MYRSTRLVRLVSACALAAVLAFALPSAASSQTFIGRGDVLVGNVAAVLDATTLQLESGQRVRLAGVDYIAPARGQQRAQLIEAATERAAEMLNGRRVWLQFDRERVDREGDLIAYVFLLPDGTFVNSELIKRGYARTFTAWSFYHRDAFLKLEREAIRSNEGLWAKLPRTSPVRRALPLGETQARRADESGPGVELDNTSAQERKPVEEPPDPMRLFEKEGTAKRSGGRGSKRSGRAAKSATADSGEKPAKKADDRSIREILRDIEASQTPTMTTPQKDN